MRSNSEAYRCVYLGSAAPDDATQVVQSYQNNDLFIAYRSHQYISLNGLRGDNKTANALNF